MFKRIKRALAAFLREELLEYVGYNHNIPLMPLKDRFMVKNVEFDTLAMERIIPVDQNHYPFDDFLPGQMHSSFEEEVQKCKQDFAQEVLKHIHVDAQELADDNFFKNRSVKFILRVQAVKERF